jgi:hypothetical protein
MQWAKLALCIPPAAGKGIELRNLGGIDIGGVFVHGLLFQLPDRNLTATSGDVFINCKYTAQSAGKQRPCIAASLPRKHSLTVRSCGRIPGWNRVPEPDAPNPAIER